jgi:hypothetical protein
MHEIINKININKNKPKQIGKFAKINFFKFVEGLAVLKMWLNSFSLGGLSRIFGLSFGYTSLTKNLK